MDAAGLTCVLVGALIILTRGPLIFAPTRTLAAYRGLLATPARIRGLGAVFAVLGGVIAFVGNDDPGLAGSVLFWLGLLMLAVAFALLAAPRAAGTFSESVMEFMENSIDPSVIRMLGALAVVLGAALIWLGVAR